VNTLYHFNCLCIVKMSFYLQIVASETLALGASEKKLSTVLNMRVSECCYHSLSKIHNVIMLMRSVPAEFSFIDKGAVSLCETALVVDYYMYN